jgi:hypothetical protein
MSSVAISAAAAGSAAAAHSKVRKLEKENCKIIVKGYEHNTTTIAEQKNYAHCINLLHSKSLDPSDVLVFKVLFIIGVIGTVITYIKYDEDDFVLKMGMMFVSFIVSPIAAVCIAGFLYGIYWVLFV